jgi:formylglycine-generating enzyme
MVGRALLLRRVRSFALVLVGVACGTSKDVDGTAGGRAGMSGTGNGGTGGGATAGSGGGDPSGGSGGNAAKGGSGGVSGSAGTPNSSGNGGKGASQGGTGGEAGGEAGSGTAGADAGQAGAAGQGTPGVTPCATQPRSCADLPKTCGPNRDGDCCESDLVPGGTYDRDNYTIEPATVSTFCLDKYEITVGRFRKFVEATSGGTPAPGAGKNPNAPDDPGWDPAWNPYVPDDTSANGVLSSTCSPGRFFTAAPGEYENYPVNCIHWYEVYAFCTWDGGWMPTRLEWDYAARGGSEQRYLPWSVPSTDRSLDATYASYACNGDGNPDDCNIFLDTFEVGSLPKGNGAFGQADLIGNVMEWVKDWDSGTVQIDCNECGDFTGGTRRNLRGGHSRSYEQNIGIIADQTDYVPEQRWGYIGGRCARAP